ncbi:response regulator [bacterium]|nr:response regulator [bacterium]
MSTSRNLALATAIFLPSLFLLLLVFARIFILESFQELEKKQTVRNMERVMDGIGSEVTAIERTVKDWSEWDDAHQFIKGNNPLFVERNLNRQSIDNLKVSTVIYITNEGKIRFAGETDPAGDGLVPIKEGLRKHLRPGSPLLAGSRLDDSRSGILLLPEGPLLISSHQVLDSHGKGSSSGLLLMGRRLDNDETAVIAGTAHVSFSLIPLSNNLQPLLREFGNLPRGASPVMTRTAGKDSIDGYGLLRDIYGKPVLLVHAVFPREILGMGREAVLYFLAWIMGIITLALLGGAMLYRMLSRSRRERLESDALFRAVVRQSSDGILLADAGSGAVKVANDAALAMIGSGREGLPSLSVQDIFGGSWPFRAGGNPDGNPAEPDTEKELILRPDGDRLLHAKVNSSTIACDGKEVLCITLRDVTGQKRAEEVLLRMNSDLELRVKERTRELSGANEQLQRDIENRKQVEAKLRKEESIRGMVFEAIPDMIAVIDRDFRIIHSNWGAGYDYVPADLRQTNPHCFDAFYPTRGKRCEPCHAQEVFVTGKPVFREKYNPRAGHKEIRAYPIFDESGGVSLVVEHIRDITERKKLEDEILKSQKLESLGVLAGGIAHDFNNLLTCVLGNISLAKLQAEPDRILVKRLEDAEKATLRAGDLTRQLLTFSRGGAPVKKAASIKQIVMDSVSFVLRGSNVRCEFSFPDDIRAVEADPGQMNQVINNLIINADQALPDGGIITVRAENVEIGPEVLPTLPAGNYVRISVQDHGCGIPESNLDKIFDPYFTTKPTGNGLGLATVYSIIRKHAGLITVDSSVGQGTTFSIYLPASDREPAVADLRNSSPDKGAGRILVMDDEEIIREVACEILEHLGYETASCGNGEQAVRLYQQSLAKEPFAAVLMDLTIPGGMGGKETMKRLREIDPDVKGIVSSGYSNDPILAHYREYGFRGVALKPYDIDELGDALRQAIRSPL